MTAPLFDLLEAAQPSWLFGEPRPVGSGFRDGVARIAGDLFVAFGLAGASGGGAIQALEDIAEQMWASGWSEDRVDGSTIPHDLGAVLTVSVQELLGGEVLARGEANWLHTSIWWEGIGVEAFPYHKVRKRLSTGEGESLTYFVRALSARVPSPESG